ncbi:MAG: TraR/DksA C4-type zinc finger protein [Desulfosarcinaceae bacterium]|nr:TraR/DksA C4-type zinc finger protein [Desulfosarcinaceae bacterium]
MDQVQKDQLAAVIQEKITIAENDIATFQSLAEPVSPDNAIGRLTRMEAINSRSINAAALRKAKQRHTRLTRALARIDDPDFGLCRECEEPIPHARLVVLPEAELCVACAESVAG